MSTYTDLHNKIKETIVVGYRPEDRVTTQKVKFYNKENEYWGTFKGTMEVEDTLINGGTLSNVTIDGGTLVNVRWPGGIDFDKYGQMIADLSAYTVGTLSDVYNTKFPQVWKAMADEVEARIHQYDGLTADISSVRADLTSQSLFILQQVRGELRDLSCALDRQDSDISTLLSAAIKAGDDYLSAAIAHKAAFLSAAVEGLSAEVAQVSSVLDAKADEVSASLTSKLAAEEMARKADDSSLSDAIDDLRADFGREVYDRQVEDTKLNAKADEISAASEAADLKLAFDLAAHKADNEAEFAETREDLSAVIEHERHYVVNEVPPAVSYDPFLAEDMAVNIYQPSLPDAKVSYENTKSHIKVGVGNIIKSTEELLPLTLKTYEHIADEGITSALVEGWSYGFTPTEKAVRTLANGYTIEFDDSKYAGSHELSDCTFQLKPTLPQYHKIRLGGVMVGKVYDAVPEGECADIDSGKLWLDTSDTELETFNKFSKMTFNRGDLSVLNKESERVTYLGENRLKFEKNIDKSKFVGLYDQLAAEHSQFGRIYEYLNGVSGVISADDGHLVEANVTLNSPYAGKVVKLSEANGFRNAFEQDVPQGDDVFADVVLSAGVDSMSADFDVVKTTELFKYAIKGADESGEIKTVGYVTPKLYNKTLIESSDFKKIDADISEVMWIEAFKRTFTLTKLDGEMLWTAEKSDALGNVLNLKFNGLELFVKVTSATEGQVIRQKYAVEIESPELANPEECYAHLYKSAVVDLSKFDEISESPAKSYVADIDPASSTDSFSMYTLDIDDKHNDVLKVQVPAKSSDDISREFIVMMKPSAVADKMVEIRLVNSDGSTAKLFNEDHSDIQVLTNQWSMIKFQEIRPDVFLAVDLEGSEDSHKIEMLRRMILAEKEDRIAGDEELSAEISRLSAALSIDIDSLSAALSGDIQELSVDLSGEIEALSSSLSTIVGLSVDSLQKQILSNDADIQDIYERIRGGLNYKGVVHGEVFDSGKHIEAVTTISNLFAWPAVDAEHLQPYADVEAVLSNGFMYYVGKLDAAEAKRVFTIEGLRLEVGDYVIVNVKGEDGKKIKDLTSADINIVDAVDNEDIEFLSAAVDTLSAGISADVQALSTALSTDINTLSSALSGDIDDLSAALSADVSKLSTDLSTDLGILSCSLSGISAEISADLSTLDAHYHKTLSGDIELTHTYVDPIDPSHTITKVIEVDQLVMVDEVTFNRYRLTVRNGTLNINKIDNILG